MGLSQHFTLAAERSGKLLSREGRAWERGAGSRERGTGSREQGTELGPLIAPMAQAFGAVHHLLGGERLPDAENAAGLFTD